MDTRRKIGATPVSSHDELGPADLIESLHFESCQIDQQELSRAEWFWRRRPKIISSDPILLFWYLTVSVCLFYYLPETVFSLLFWLALGASFLWADNIRLCRWRNEYASSIKRVIIHPVNQK